MRFLLLLLALVASNLTPACGADRPNVIVILADDLGWGSVGCYGADPKLVRTPNIDTLASEGRRFTDANTTSSVCSPTRYAMLTGRYCWRTSLVSEVLPTTAPLHIETDRLTLASLLKSKGYNCAAIGKWHLGYGVEERCDFTKELKPGPLEIGFDYHFGVPSNHGDVSGVYVENHWVWGLNKESPAEPSPTYVPVGAQNGRDIQSMAINAPKRVDDEVMNVLTDKTVSWLEQQTSDRPFFLYYTPVAVHNPITPSKETKGKSTGGIYCDFLHDLDNSVGRILDVLKRKGLAENTLIVFTSDNGGVNKQNGNTPQNAARDAGLKPVGPFRGGKHDVWEGGFRVPYIVRWPQHVPAGTTSDQTISLVDTLASVASIVGEPLPTAHQGAEDSFDVSAAWLEREPSKPIRPFLIVHSADGNFAIQKNGWKWIEGLPADDVKPASNKARAEQFHPMLYNIDHDIAETRDLATDEKQRAADLKALLDRYRDGGYSRELPPAVDKKASEKPSTTAMPLESLSGKILFHDALDQSPKNPWQNQASEWIARDGAARTIAPVKGATLTRPVAFHNGVLQFEVLLGEADRHSLRIQPVGNERSFRTVLSRSNLEIAINPPQGESATATIQLAKRRLKLDTSQWQTVRVRFEDDKLIVETAGQTITVSDARLNKTKQSLNFIAFDGEVALRNVTLTEMP
ncbi:MAG: arylsulfatase [Pirellulales bacterium]